MPLLNSRDNETSRGKSNMVKIKTQDFQPLLCDNTEDHGSVPETRERDKGGRDLRGAWERTWRAWKRTHRSLRRPGSQPGCCLVWRQSLESLELDLRMLSEFEIVCFMLKC